MDFKVPKIHTSNPVIWNFQDKLKGELFDTKASLYARVLERSAGNNEYLLSFSGKLVRLFSETKLLIGENLQMQAKNEGSKLLLEIVKRSNSNNSSINETNMERVWSKTYYSPIKTMLSMLESNLGEVSLNKVFQYLDVFFPGIEWNARTAQFEWKFEDGEANGFFGKNKDSFGFYFHFESKKLGSVDTYLNWKKEDLSDVVFHFVFNSISTYLLANENLHEFKKMLSTNSIFTNNIIFHYSSAIREKGEWVA